MRLFQFLNRPQLRRNRQSQASSTSVEVAVLEQRLLLTVVNMTDQEQLLLELINRARANPQAEANRYSIALNQGLSANTISTDAKQPLAPHQILVNIAGAHSQDMLNRDYFSHTTLGTTNGAGERAVAALYPAPATSVGENIAWGGSTGLINQNQQVLDRHRALFLSAGHRQNMLHPPYEEVGTGIRYGQFTDAGTTYNAAMVTENFGVRGLNPYITGVVFTDLDADDFYDIGESIRSGTVTATNLNTRAVYSETIGISGAYGIIVPAGPYSVAATYTVGGVTTTSSQIVTVGTDNLKVDFDTTSPSSVELMASSGVTALNETGSIASTVVTVTRTGSTAAALTVTLASGDVTEATVPASVVISAGQTSAQFIVSAVNDSVIDGTQPVQITTSAAGYSSGVLALTVADRTFPALPSAVQTVETSRPTFTWSSVSNAATYEIWVNNVTTNESRVINVTGLTDTSYTAETDLGIGNYNVWVRGATSTGLLSIWSPVAVWRVRPKTTIEGSGRTETTSSFNISWSPIPGALSYDIWIDRQTSRTSQYLRNTDVVGTTLAVTDFAIGRYNVWVRGRNRAGDLVGWSAPAVINVNLPVSGLNVSAATLDSAATLNWEAVDGATSYDVWIDRLTSGTSQFIRNQSVSTNSLALALSAGSYRAWVRARDVNGAYYRWSPSFDFEFQRAPRLLTPTVSSQVARPLFTWTVVSGATSYQLVIADTALTPLITENGLTQNAYTPSADLAAGSYRAWIRAIDGNGNQTSQSNLISFTVASSSERATEGKAIAPDDVEMELHAMFASLDLWGTTKESEELAVGHTAETQSTGHQSTGPKSKDDRVRTGIIQTSIQSSSLTAGMLGSPWTAPTSLPDQDASGIAETVIHSLFASPEFDLLALEQQSESQQRPV